MDPHPIIETTRRWIDSVVIGLNLCPFAARVFQGEKIRYVVSDAGDEDALLQALAAELQFLAAAPLAEVETTLLIHPRVLDDFLDYNDFIGRAEDLLTELDLWGTVQIASFHPRYQFASTRAEDVENYTNRSPYPMLHLLREESISAIDAEEEELLEIPRRNVETLKALGREKILEMLEGINSNPPDHPP